MKLLPYEIWRDIPGFEGEYQASTMGNIRSLPRFINSRKRKIHRNGCTIKPWASKSISGFVYYRVTLNKKNYYIHRLTLLTFVGPPKPNKPEVNHKDENPANNSISNLEYCDRVYNINYGTGIKRRSTTNTNGKTSKAVNQYNLEGIFIKRFQSIHEVERTLGIPCGNVWKCCTGKRNNTGGFIWKYADD